MSPNRAITWAIVGHASASPSLSAASQAEAASIASDWRRLALRPLAGLTGLTRTSARRGWALT